MKRALILLSSLLLVGLSTPVGAQTTGKAAMRIVARDRGADYLPRMLHLTGEKGTHQPAVWRIIARDARGAVREFYVGKGAILSDGVLPPSQANGISSTPLPMHRLNIDSDTAFTKVEAAAKAAKIGFDSANYQLRCLELSTNAAWFLTLLNAQGNRVGEVSIGASTGTVLTQKWFHTPVPPAPPQGATAWDKTKNGISKGAEGVKNGVNNTFGWFRNKVTPAPQPPASPYYVPPSR